MTEKSVSQLVQEIIKKIRIEKPGLDPDQPFNVCLFSEHALRDQGFQTTRIDLEEALTQLLRWHHLEPKWVGEVLYYLPGTGKTIVAYTIIPK